MSGINYRNLGIERIDNEMKVENNASEKTEKEKNIKKLIEKIKDQLHSILKSINS